MQQKNFVQGQIDQAVTTFRYYIPQNQVTTAETGPYDWDLIWFEPFICWLNQPF